MTGKFEMLVNFVISQDKASRIFSDIFRRFMDDRRISLAISEVPIEGADVYHYHRPQLEEGLRENSVVTVHHDLDDPDPFVRWDGFEKNYKEAKRIICLNSLQRDILHKKGLVNTEIIPHGYDEKLFEKKISYDPINDSKVTLGIISKRYPRRFKGEAYLYELLDHLSVDRFRFVLVGEGRSEDAHYLRSIGYDVELHEWLPYRLFPTAYASIDCLLMVSTFEGGPANLPEAVASGTPVICTRVGMVPDMIQDGINGVILSGNVLKDRDVFENLHDYSSGYLHNLKLGAGRLHTAPTWTEVIERHLNLYTALLSDIT